MAALKLMLVDDQLLVRAGFKRLLMALDDVSVVAEASTGEEALVLFKQHQPDMVLLELDIPGMGGLETAKRLLVKFPKAKIIALTVHEEITYLKRVLACGALGYLSKKSAQPLLDQAIRAVAQKKRFIEPDLSQKLFLAELDGVVDPLESLSSKEFGVFIQFAKGLSLSQVADRLALSEATISTHLYSIKQKLQLSNNSELILIARRLGLIFTSES